MSDRTLADRLGDLIGRIDELRTVEQLAQPYPIAVMRDVLEALTQKVLDAKTDDERREAAAEARAFRSLITWMEGIPRALKTAESTIAKLKGRHPDAG